MAPHKLRKVAATRCWKPQLRVIDETRRASVFSEASSAPSIPWSISLSHLSVYFLKNHLKIYFPKILPAIAWLSTTLTSPASSNMVRLCWDLPEQSLKCRKIKQVCAEFFCLFFLIFKNWKMIILSHVFPWFQANFSTAFILNCPKDLSIFSFLEKLLSCRWKLKKPLQAPLFPLPAPS